MGWRWQFSHCSSRDKQFTDHITVVLGSEALRHRRIFFSGKENTATRARGKWGLKQSEREVKNLRLPSEPSFTS